MKRVGTGEHAIVCLHGWYGHADGWGFLPDLVDTETFSYYFPEMRGYGQRKGETGEYTMWEYATDALAAADEAGLSTFSVLGHSMGGKAAAALLAQAPDRVRAIIGLSAVWPGQVPLDADGEALFFGAPDESKNRYGIIDFTTGGVESPHWVQSMVDDSLATSSVDAFRGAVESWVGDDYLEQVGTVAVPALFITGAYDPALSAEGAKQTWGTITPDAEFLDLPGAGHYATHEMPLALVTAVEAFARQH